MRSIISLLIVDAAGATWEAIGGQGGSLSFESEPYHLRVAFPLAVGKILGLPEHEAIGLARRAKVSRVEVALDSRVTAVGLYLARALPFELTGSAEGEAKICAALQEELGTVIIALGAKSAGALGRLDLSTPEGFNQAYCAIESGTFERLLPSRGLLAPAPRL